MLLYLRLAAVPLLTISIIDCVSAAPVALAGLVLDDESGRGLAKARVTVREIPTGREIAEIQTDSTGRFQIENWAPNGYRIDISKAAYLTVSATLSGVEAPSPARNRPWTFRLIRYGAISGRVLDAAAGPLPNAEVIAFRKSRLGLAPWALRPPVEVDRNGAYRISGLAPGDYLVGALGAVSGITRLTGILLFPDESRPIALPVLGGEEHENVDFRSPRDNGFRIQGRIPPGDAKSQATALSLVEAERPGLQLSAKSDPVDGRFTFENVLTGNYEILARRHTEGAEPQFGRVRVAVRGSGVDGVEISLGPGSAVTLKLDPAGPDSAEKCTGPATVKLSILDGVQSGSAATRQASEREPAVFRSLAPALYRVDAVSGDGRCRNRLPALLDLRENERAREERIVMARRGSIRGTVEPAAGLTDSFVILLPFGSTDPKVTVLVTRPSQSGDFAFEDLESGSYFAMPRSSTVDGPRWRPGAQDSLVEVGPGVERQVRLPRSADGWN